MKHDRACPVVLDEAGDDTKILIFRHPLAGLQLVKGRLERGETPMMAARRELIEESGLIPLSARAIGCVSQPELSQNWHLFRCDVPPTPETWHHAAPDDGGHNFHFFWHPLFLSLDAHPCFERARRHVADHCRKTDLNR